MYQGLKLKLLTISIGFATFMEVLDTSIANVAVPTIAGDLAVSPSQGTWVISSYSVASAIAVPLTGWLAKRFGEIRLFLLAIMGFTIMSALCGLAQNLQMLVICRIFQGLLSGPMVPLSQSILLKNYPQNKQGLALGLWSMTVVVAPIFGPLLGGWITNRFHWSWIFFINVPIGIFAIICNGKLLKGQESIKTKLPIDVIGLSLLVLGVGCFQLMLDNGNNLDWFNSSFILSLAIIALICIILFIPWTIYEKFPIVDLSLFKNRNFLVGVITQTLGFMTFFSSVVIFPLWRQTVMGYPSDWAGYATAPIGILSLFLSPFVGKNLHRIDLRIVASLAFIIFASIAFWCSQFTLEASFEQLILPRFIQGIGIACFFIPVSALIISGIPNEKIASAASLSNFMRVLAGGIGTAVSVTLWQHRAEFHHTILVEALQNDRPAFNNYVQTLKNLKLDDSSIIGQLENVLSSQSYMLATNDIFWLTGIIFLGLLVVVWFAKPPFAKKPSMGH